MDQREKALARRHAKREKDLTEHTKVLAPLSVGQVVLIQNQSGNNPLRWDRSGQVVEVLPFDQYRIKMDGTGRSSLRNRKFLRAIKPFSQSDREIIQPLPSSTVDTDIGADQEPEPHPHLLDQGDVTTPTAASSTVRRSARPSKPPVRLGLAGFTCSRSSQGGEHR